ncbi:hypothetical protein K438DRAFT_1761486 [Mycena galopus ATCC 62051]|nr:hypothetical protein K438DRAFT_1761486 [Mycena galopus ATCC 62051]
MAVASSVFPTELQRRGEDGESGEFMVGRGANHAWHNRTQAPCCIVVVMYDASNYVKTVKAVYFKGIKVRVSDAEGRKNGPPSRVAVVEQENIETVHAPKHIQAAGALCMDRVAVLWSDPTAHRPREVKGPVPSSIMMDTCQFNWVFKLRLNRKQETSKFSREEGRNGKEEIFCYKLMSIQNPLSRWTSGFRFVQVLATCRDAPDSPVDKPRIQALYQEAACRDLTDLYVRLLIGGFDHVGGFCSGLPLINTRRVILVDSPSAGASVDAQKNKKVTRHLSASFPSGIKCIPLSNGRSPVPQVNQIHSIEHVKYQSYWTVQHILTVVNGNPKFKALVRDWEQKQLRDEEEEGWFKQRFSVGYWRGDLLASRKKNTDFEIDELGNHFCPEESAAHAEDPLELKELGETIGGTLKERSVLLDAKSVDIDLAPFTSLTYLYWAGEAKKYTFSAPAPGISALPVLEELSPVYEAKTLNLRATYEDFEVLPENFACRPGTHRRPRLVWRGPLYPVHPTPPRPARKWPGLSLPSITRAWRTSPLKEVHVKEKIKWPTTRQQARKDSWVALSEVLHQKGIKLTDGNGITGPTGARAQVSTRRR